MPQLAVETFASQIFWILIGFFLIYGFMSVIAGPNIEETIEKRENHINGIKKEAENLNFRAERIEKIAADALERAEVEAIEAESKLISSLREQNVKEKEALYEIFSKESRTRAAELSRNAENCFNEISTDIYEIVDVAMNKITAVNTKDKIG